MKTSCPAPASLAAARARHDAFQLSQAASAVRRIAFQTGMQREIPKSGLWKMLEALLFHIRLRLRLPLSWMQQLTAAKQRNNLCLASATRGLGRALLHRSN